MKVLIMGLGSIALKHVDALKSQHEDIEIFALRSSENAEQLPNVKNLFSYNILKEFNFDFFLITNPTAKHTEALENVLKFKKPLFIEKPIFSDIGAQNQKILDEIKENKISSYVGCNLRFLDCLIEIKKIVKDLKINEVNSYAGSFLPDWRPGVDFRSVYSADKNLGGGVHMDLIHELDYIYWIFGKPISVRKSFSNKSSLAIDVVDYANYLWEYNVFYANIVLNYYRKDSKRSLEVLTETGTFYVDLLKNKILRNGVEIFSSNQTIRDTYSKQMNFFLQEKILNSGNNFNNADEAYKVLQLCIED